MKMKRVLHLLIAVSVALFTALPAFAAHDTYESRPIPMGVSIGNTPSSPYIYTGTAGMMVNPFGNPSIKLILSNNHVLGAVGPTLCPDTAPMFTWTLQPGTLDIGSDPGNDPTYLAGLVVKTVPMTMSVTASNQVDAALAFTTDAFASNKIKGIGPGGADVPPTKAFALPSVGMSLVKSGRTTGVTYGTVDSTNATVLVNYGDCGTARFVNQVMTDEIGISGDSGSAVLDAQTLTPVGLYFAGGGGTGVMNHLYFVYTKLGVFVDGVAPLTASADARALAAMSTDDVLAADPQVAALIPGREKFEARYFAQPGVVGLGIGRVDTGDMGYVLYVTQKNDHLVNALKNVQNEVPIRIVVSGPIEAH